MAFRSSCAFCWQGLKAAGHEIAGVSEPGHNGLAAAMAFLTVDKPVSRFYVFVPGKLYISGGSVYGRPDFCSNLYHMVSPSFTL